MLKRSLLLIIAISASFSKLSAQCAMCKTTVVNNVNHGELSLAEGLNFGIIYLFTTPYLAVLLIGFLWYRNSKRSSAKSRSYS